MSPKGLITGITGQDGYYLAQLLHAKGYEVYGLMRRSLRDTEHRLVDLPFVIPVLGDLTDSQSLREMVTEIQPDELYNLAAQSHLAWSFKVPEWTFDINAAGCLRLLEAVRQLSPQTRFYQASSSEMFGQVQVSPQNENTPFHPRSPYGFSKVAAYWAAVNYRETYGLYACNGILFNHESERRGEEFVTRKITMGIARIKLGLQDKLALGNLDAQRDWGHARDHVEAMWMMLQQEKPDDFVIGTGETHSVREFCEIAFSHVGLNYQDHVFVDPEFFRPTESHVLMADASKARTVLGWNPHVKFKELACSMVDADLARVAASGPAVRRHDGS